MLARSRAVRPHRGIRDSELLEIGTVTGRIVVVTTHCRPKPRHRHLIHLYRWRIGWANDRDVLDVLGPERFRKHAHALSVRGGAAMRPRIVIAMAFAPTVAPFAPFASCGSSRFGRGDNSVRPRTLREEKKRAGFSTKPARLVIHVAAYSSPACTLDGVSGRGGCSSGTFVTARTMRR